MYAIIVVALVAVTVRAQKIKPQTPEAIADQIVTLPGYSGALSPGFSGYLHINGSVSGTTSKHMHYWLVESLGDANADNSISFWTNGAYLHDILGRNHTLTNPTSSANSQVAPDAADCSAHSRNLDRSALPPTASLLTTLTRGQSTATLYLLSSPAG